MRRLRSLIAIPAIAGLAIMGATGASAAAAPVHQAAHARTVTAASSGADPWEFENANNLWICSGGTHESQLEGCGAPGSVDEYTIYPQSGAGAGYYVVKQGGFCWDTPGAAGDEIALESCPANDPNEWFALVPSGESGFMWLYGTDLCVWGAGVGKTVFLKTCGASNRDTWESIYVSS
jgi:hypothetical protein